MPVSFVRLRIAGFKSFAEPAVVEILPGLTGVVGPNGCGKSNVVEALRWAMGETSARALRGGEMDDVIFAGTANRPSRNLAEVTVTLEDAAGLAPPPFHELHELQVSRRIERGAGSTYRVNNREARARDVQTLFADLASGARASAMVSQGRVAAIVTARPEERRAVLEEAAGITGLHARRHEAELKLRAAEANLERAEDGRVQLEAQLQSLRRQAREAARFRAVAGLAAAAEAELFALARARTERDRAAAAAAFAAASDAAEAAAAAAAQAESLAAAAVDALPALRAAEAGSRAALERARVLREGTAEAVARAQSALDAAAARVGQIARDLGHAEQLGNDAADALRRLEAEAAALATAGSDFDARRTTLEDADVASRAAAAAAEAEASAATAAHAASGARREAAARRLAETAARARRATEAADRAAADHAATARRAVDPARIAAAEATLAAAVAARDAAAAAHDEADRARAAAGPETARARAAASAAEAAHARLAAEHAGLADLLAAAAARPHPWTPVLDALRVPPGLEAAVAAALGEALDAATDAAAARHWRTPPDPPGDLPASGASLLALVEAPPALHQALAAVRLVDHPAVGDAAQPGLPPGASLVTREGGLWRWDGYVVRPGAPAPAAIRLQARNRLHAVRAGLAEAEAARTAARAAREAAEAAERTATGAEARASAARRAAEPPVESARAALADLRAGHEAAAARLAAAAEAEARLRPERDAARTALAEAERDAAALPDPAAARAELDRTRATLLAARAAAAAAARALDTATRDHAARTARARTLAAEAEGWRTRAADAASRVVDLRARAAEAGREHHALSGEPERVRRAQSEAASSFEAAGSAHDRAAAALAAGQSRAEAAAAAERAAAATRAAARESLLRAEAALAAAEHACGTVAVRVLERLGPAPALPDPPADLSPEAEDRARRKLDRLQRERDGIGPVNARAEGEAESVAAQADAVARERDEITAAIAKLRGSLGHLNREGRERLAAVFTEVDRHFQSLFARMFGGGRAHLATVGSDDLLHAGLEIYAQPPGKKLATLSLLSGGEQALTALSLVFAIFRCNPAPICVLDEVDAPLDDANVERFCTLLDDMVRETATRFLVVTHHTHTMARMDRLFGITMQERGVSRVLSVDLQRAAAMVEQSAAAAE